MGASLLAKGACQSRSMPDVSSPSRAGSLPHWIFAGHRICVRPNDLVLLCFGFKMAKNTSSIEQFRHRRETLSNLDSAR
ncbi:MAG TPA: hypothetical protein DIW52_10925 [Pseudomonas sp.]|nr:hypothetical protein [Pseudomonas sp.]